MANFNPTPALGGALWSGNQQLITKREFYSTISSLSTNTTPNGNISSLYGYDYYQIVASTFKPASVDFSFGGNTTNMTLNTSTSRTAFFQMSDFFPTSGLNIYATDTGVFPVTSKPVRITANFGQTELVVSPFTSSVNIKPLLNVSSINVSSINGLEFTQTGITTSTVNATTGEFLTTILSTLQFNPNFSAGGINPSFNVNLGLGDGLAALAGAFGLGVMGAAVAVPVTAGTLTYGLVQGINSIVAPRTVNNFNPTTYEQLNGVSQLEVSTLGSDTTTFFRSLSTIASTIVINPAGSTVSSINIEKITSTIIPAGTTCLRTVADPIQFVSTPWTFNQAVSQWTPIPSGGGGGGITSTISTNFIVYNGGTTNGVGLTNNIGPGFNNLTWLYPVDNTFGYQTINGFTIGQGLNIVNKNTLANGELIVQRIDFNSQPFTGPINPMPCIQGDNSFGASINIEADVLQCQVDNAIFYSTISLVPSTCMVSQTAFAGLKVLDSSSTIKYGQVAARAYTMRADDVIGTTEGTLVYQNLIDRAGFVDATLTTNTLAYLSEVPGPLTKYDQSLPINPNATLNGGSSPQFFLFPNAPGGPSINIPTVAGGFYVIQSAMRIQTSVAGFPFRVYVVNGGGANDATVIQDETDPYSAPPLDGFYNPFSVFFQAQGSSVQMAISAATLPGGQSINIILKPWTLWRIR